MNFTTQPCQGTARVCSYGELQNPSTHPELKASSRGKVHHAEWDVITSAAPCRDLGDACLVLPGEDLQGLIPMVAHIPGNLTPLRNAPSPE